MVAIGHVEFQPHAEVFNARSVSAVLLDTARFSLVGPQFTMTRFSIKHACPDIAAAQS